MPVPSRRLDSWKEIADYLHRDVRTAMRWAKSQGLPVHRVAGGKGRSVFAFTGDIDGWLVGRAEPTALDPPPPPPVVSRRPVLILGGALAVVTVALLVVMKAGWASGAATDAFSVSVGSLGVHLKEAAGAPRLIYPFDPHAGIVTYDRPDSNESVADLDADGELDILVGIISRQASVDRVVRSGELLRLTPRGDVKWQFALDDELTFGGQSFGPPWSLVDWRPAPGRGRRRVAIAAHHYTWWPSMVTILDDGGHRLGSFVNAGWVESVRWLDADRLVIAGFNNPMDGGMLGVLDARSLRGRSPDGPRQYVCDGCLDGDPVHYLVFPRSEVNVAMSAPFNAAGVEVMPDRIIVQTREVDPERGNGAVALYEFDRSLRLLKASYSGRYWELHSQLEQRGVLNHDRARCPQRDGPPAVRSWSRHAGWQEVPGL